MAALVLGCGPKEEETVFRPDPLEEVKALFAARPAGADSTAVVETDTTITYYLLPKNEFVPGEALFGAFSIDKRTILEGDLNQDGLEDAVVQYSFTPHLENNTLIYFKVLLQEGGTLEEVGEIFGGGRCEGPILTPMEIKKGIIYFNSAEYAPSDPCCCPSVHKNAAFKLEGGQLIATNEL